MFINRILVLGIRQPNLLRPVAVFAHNKTCPVAKREEKVKIDRCKGKGTTAPSGGGTGQMAASSLVRAQKPGLVRLGFLPDEWFQFFKTKTGVTGPYFLLIGITNYALSKEIYVMEHEYYLGLSIALILYLVTTKLGPQIGASLDKEVDAVSAEFQKTRDDELSFYKNMIKMSEDAIWRAEGQKLLMDAKKENVAMQLEAAYRERLLIAFWAVRGRMDYHIKKQAALIRIHQKWMIEWILENVRRSITPEFQKQALASAIGELAAMSSTVSQK